MCGVSSTAGMTANGLVSLKMKAVRLDDNQRTNYLTNQPLVNTEFHRYYGNKWVNPICD